MENNTQEKIKPHELAMNFEFQIKEVISNKFSIPLDDLELLLNDEDGVYLSDEEIDILCCFALGTKNGHMYLATGKIGSEGKSVSDIKADIIS